MEYTFFVHAKFVNEGQCRLATQLITSSPDAPFCLDEVENDLQAIYKAFESVEVTQDVTFYGKELTAHWMKGSAHYVRTIVPPFASGLIPQFSVLVLSDYAKATGSVWREGKLVPACFPGEEFLLNAVNTHGDVKVLKSLVPE